MDRKQPRYVDQVMGHDGDTQVEHDVGKLYGDTSGHISAGTHLYKDTSGHISAGKSLLFPFRLISSTGWTEHCLISMFAHLERLR